MVMTISSQESGVWPMTTYPLIDFFVCLFLCSQEKETALVAAKRSATKDSWLQTIIM